MIDYGCVVCGRRAARSENLEQEREVSPRGAGEGDRLAGAEVPTERLRAIQEGAAALADSTRPQHDDTWVPGPGMLLRMATELLAWRSLSPAGGVASDAGSNAWAARRQRPRGHRAPDPTSEQVSAVPTGLAAREAYDRMMTDLAAREAYRRTMEDLGRQVFGESVWATIEAPERETNSEWHAAFMIKVWFAAPGNMFERATQMYAAIVAHPQYQQMRHVPVLLASVHAGDRADGLVESAS